MEDKKGINWENLGSAKIGFRSGRNNCRVGLRRRVF
jgi:hypothetical protein